MFQGVFAKGPSPSCSHALHWRHGHAVAVPHAPSTRRAPLLCPSHARSKQHEATPAPSPNFSIPFPSPSSLSARPDRAGRRRCIAAVTSIPAPGRAAQKLRLGLLYIFAAGIEPGHRTGLGIERALPPPVAVVADEYVAVAASPTSPSSSTSPG